MGQQKKEGSQHRSFLFRERGEKKSRDCYRTYDTFSFCDHYIRKHPHSTQHSVSFWKKRRLITLITLSARGGIAYHPPIPSVRKFSPSKSRAGWLANRKLDDVVFFLVPKMAPSAATHLSSMERRALSADQNVLMTHLVVWLLSLVSGILLGLRLFTKWLRAQQLWSDDGFLIASWVSHA